VSGIQIRYVFGGLRTHFPSFPFRYGIVPMGTLQDIESIFYPAPESCRMSPVPLPGNSGRKTASIFRIYFRPVPLQSSLETAGIQRKRPIFLEDPAGSACRNHRHR
jgi:hypothetical protein